MVSDAAADTCMTSGLLFPPFVDPKEREAPVSPGVFRMSEFACPDEETAVRTWGPFGHQRRLRWRQAGIGWERLDVSASRFSRQPQWRLGRRCPRPRRIRHRHQRLPLRLRRRPPRRQLRRRPPRRQSRRRLPPSPQWLRRSPRPRPTRSPPVEQPKAPPPPPPGRLLRARRRRAHPPRARRQRARRRRARPHRARRPPASRRNRTRCHARAGSPGRGARRSFGRVGRAGDCAARDPGSGSHHDPAPGRADRRATVVRSRSGEPRRRNRAYGSDRQPEGACRGAPISLLPADEAAAETVRAIRASSVLGKHSSSGPAHDRPHASHFRSCKQARAIAVLRATLISSPSPEVRAAIDRVAARVTIRRVEARPPPESKAAEKHTVAKARPIAPFGHSGQGIVNDGFNGATGSTSSSRLFALAAVPLRVPLPFRFARLRLPSTRPHGVIAAPPTARPG